MNRRKLIAAATATGGLALAGGGTWWYLREEAEPKGASDRIDLLAGVYSGLPHQSEPDSYAMLSISGGMPANTGLELRFFDLNAEPVTEVPDLSVMLSNLVTGETTEDIEVSQQGDGSWQLTQDAVQSDGWWQIVVTLGDSIADWTFLMPDPNLTGFETPPQRDTDPDASAMLAASLNALTNRTSLRWWEWLSGGNGAIILAKFSVTTPESNGQPASFESDSILAGRIPLDGSPASFRADNVRTISTQDRTMRSVNGGTPEAANTIRYLTIDQYDTTYAGHEGAHFGTIAYIEGRRCQLVAFFLPGAIDAWFAFWIDIETMFVRELYMVSVNHYMHWVYFDIDEPFELAL